MTPPQDDPSAVRHDASNTLEGGPRPAGGDAAGGASIDKVRDLLFGNQLRELDRRFAQLEERVARETGQLREEMKTRLDAFEAYARSETSSLADRIRAGHEAGLEAQDSLARDLRETAKSLERRTAAVDEQSSKAHRELRQQMLEQHQRLSDEIRRRTDDLLATISREAQTLRSDKTDRSTLAAMLNEMAMRLTDDLRVPDGEDGGNG